MEVKDFKQQKRPKSHENKMGKNSYEKYTKQSGLDLKSIKKQMLEYRDYYGGDLLNVSDIKSAKSKRELRDILQNHYKYIADMANDAQRDLERFQDSLGLSLLEIDE